MNGRTDPYRIAVAGRYGEREAIKDILFHNLILPHPILPVRITATWLSSIAETDGDLTPEQAVAQRDCNRREIILAHLLLYFPCWVCREGLEEKHLCQFSVPRWSPGRLIDYGIALGHGTRIVIVGKPEPSIYFHSHDAITVCEPATLHETIKTVLQL